MEQLGVHAYRQFVNVELLWDVVNTNESYKISVGLAQMVVLHSRQRK